MNIINVVHLDMKGLDLSNRVINLVNVVHANLDNADLSNSHINAVNITHLNMEGATTTAFTKIRETRIEDARELDLPLGIKSNLPALIERWDKRYE